MEGGGGSTSNRAWIEVLEANGDRLEKAFEEIIASLSEMKVSMHRKTQEMEAIRRTSVESIERVKRRIAEAQDLGRTHDRGSHPAIIGGVLTLKETHTNELMSKSITLVLPSPQGIGRTHM